MENLVTYTNYQQFKEELDKEVKKTAESFVKIGYLLNIAATTDILLESGYANVNEMAWNEYKLDPSQTSRFIGIYREFGVEGQPELQDKYKEHGVAKLGIMLTLPSCVNEEISSDYSKSEIKAIKKEIDAEKKISDIEVMCEEKSTLQQLLPEGLKQVVLQFVKEYPQEYVNLYDAVTLKDVKEIVTPNGVATYKIRIPGIGLNLMFVKANENIVVTNTRTGEKNTYEWEEFFNGVKDYFVLGANAKESWSNIFKEPFPEDPEPAMLDNNNVQQSKPAPKKESKVKIPAPKPKHEPEPAPKEDEPVKEPEEQIPGQDSILNHPEYLSEDMKEREVLTGEVENITADASQIRADVITVGETANADNDNVQQAHEGMKVEHFAPVQESSEEMIKTCKRELEQMTNDLGDHFDNEEWDKMSAVATNIVWKIKTLKKLEGLN